MAKKQTKAEALMVEHAQFMEEARKSTRAHRAHEILLVLLKRDFIPYSNADNLAREAVNFCNHLEAELDSDH